MRTIAMLTLLTASLCFGQESGDFKPATSNVLDAQFPKVDSTSRVQIRFKAPDAGKVRVNFSRYGSRMADVAPRPERLRAEAVPAGRPEGHDGAKTVGSSKFFFPEHPGR